MLSKKKKYLQIALNSTLDQAHQIINQLPANERIIIEAGTPLLKKYGESAITRIKAWWHLRLSGKKTAQPTFLFSPKIPLNENLLQPYLVADYKAMDRGATEVRLAAAAGANAITVLGQAPPETINNLIETCRAENIETIVDMMNVDKPYQVLRKLKKLPQIVMLHRGVDETEAGNKPLPIHQIIKVKGAYDVMVAIGGGDTTREVQSAFFNGANIVMLWKEFYQSQSSTTQIAQEFLKQVK
ncbi:orotidine 5'-phosphate decarboxylase / HUMPS family protein [Patescibacteria group bacterium]